MLIDGDYSRGFGLLQEEFGHQQGVGVARLPPREFPQVILSPPLELLAEPLAFLIQENLLPPLMLMN